MKRTILLISVLILAALGVADGAYLTKLKVEKEVQGQASSQICRSLSRQGCDIALESGPSSIGPVPISLIAAVTYGLVFGLGVLLLLGKTPVFAPAALQLIALGAVLWSIGLAIYSWQQGSWCPFCIGLYGINLLLLLVTSLLAGRGPLKGVAAGLRDVWERRGAALVALVAFVGLTGAAQAVLQWRIGVLTADRTAADRERIQAAITEGTFPAPPAGLPAVGPEDAPLTLVKLSDFECPYCQKYWFQIEELREKHPDLVRVVFNNYPLSNECNPMMGQPFHKHACTAAYAAWCAHQQGKFWELADLMFANQRDLGRDQVLGYAEDAGIGMGAFRQCIDAPATKAAVARQALYARSLGAEGTPATLLNRFLLSGGLSAASLAAIAEEPPDPATANPSELTQAQDAAIAGGREPLEPSPRALPSKSTSPIDVVAWFDPNPAESRDLLQALGMMHLAHKKRVRVSLRLLPQPDCATSDAAECLISRAVACAFETDRAGDVLIFLGRQSGNPEQRVEPLRKELPALAECLDDGGATAILQEDAAAAEAAGIKAPPVVFIDGYRLSAPHTVSALDAMLARVLLERRDRR